MQKIIPTTRARLKGGRVHDRPNTPVEGGSGDLRGCPVKTISEVFQAKDPVTGEMQDRVCVAQTTQDGPGFPIDVPVSLLKVDPDQPPTAGGTRLGAKLLGSGIGPGKKLPKKVREKRVVYGRDGYEHITRTYWDGTVKKTKRRI